MLPRDQTYPALALFSHFPVFRPARPFPRAADRRRRVRGRVRAPKGLPNRPGDALFGLPSYLKIEEYRRDPLCYLSSFKYKVEAAVGPTAAALQPLLTVLDTGARPNLTRADLLPPEILDELDSEREIVRLASASDHRLDVFGASQTVREPFVVYDSLEQTLFWAAISLIGQWRISGLRSALLFCSIATLSQLFAAARRSPKKAVHREEYSVAAFPSTSGSGAVSTACHNSCELRGRNQCCEPCHRH